MWNGVLCNNYAKCKEEEGYLKVGLGSPCLVLQQPKYILQYLNYVSSWRTWRGDHRPTKICCFVITTPNVKRRRG